MKKVSLEQKKIDLQKDIKEYQENLKKLEQQIRMEKLKEFVGKKGECFKRSKRDGSLYWYKIVDEVEIVGMQITNQQLHKFAPDDYTIMEIVKEGRYDSINKEEFMEFCNKFLFPFKIF